MSNTALVVIDIQNDITKHYRDILSNLNASIDWAAAKGMDVVYIKHNNLSPGTRTFKPDTKGAQSTGFTTQGKETCAQSIPSEDFVSMKEDEGTSKAFMRSFINPLFVT